MLFGSRQAPNTEERLATLEALADDVVKLRGELENIRNQLRHERILAIAGIAIALIAAGGTIWQASVAQSQLAAAGPNLRGSAAVITAVDNASMFEPGNFGEYAYSAGEAPRGNVEVRVELTNVGQSVATIEKAEVAWSEGNLLVGTLHCGVDESTRSPLDCPKPLQLERGEIEVFTLAIPQPLACVDWNPRVETTRVILTMIDGDVLDLSTGVGATNQSVCPDYGGN